MVTLHGLLSHPRAYWDALQISQRDSCDIRSGPWDSLVQLRIWLDHVANIGAQ
jgi:hypothetical protein